MVSKLRFFAILFSFLLVSETAFSHFKTSRIGGSKGLVVTPVADQIVSLTELLNDPDAVLTNEILQDLIFDVSAFGDYPLDQYKLNFIKSMLMGTELGTSQTALQDSFDERIADNATACPSSNCSLASADWQHEQISEDNSSAYFGQWGLITTNLLDDLIGTAGYTSTVLVAGDANITDIREDILFRSIPNEIGASSLPNIDEIKNRINEAAGFVAAVDTDDDFNSADYNTAQTVVNAFLLNSNAANFTSGTFTACYLNTETARSGGPNTCTVTADFWTVQQTILTTFDSLKEDIADNATLTQSQLESIGLDLTTLGTPISTWQLQYVSNVLDADADAIADWQTTITNYNAQNAALWKVGQVAAGVTGHQSSEITNVLLDTAVGSGFSSTDALAVVSDRTVPGFTADASFTNLAAPNNTATNVKAQLLSYVGLSTAEYDEWNSNPDSANYTLADFNACFTSNDPLTGGPNTCSISNSNWSSLSNLTAAVIDNSTSGMTEVAIDALYSIDNSSYDVNLNDSVNLSYVQNCFSNLTLVTSITLKSCVANSNEQVAAKWKIYQISLEADNTSHPITDLTPSLYDRAVNNSSGFLQDILDARPSYSLDNLRSALAGYFTANSITDQSSDDAFKLFPVSRVGFRDGLVSYNSWVSNTGFSVDTVDNSSEDIVRVWEACRRSLDSLSGGSGSCSPSYSDWRARAEDRASNFIIQVRSNDYFHGVNSGPRVYPETLMGMTINLHSLSSRDSTYWQWLDQHGNSQTTQHGWTTGNGSYAFWYGGLDTSPPIGALLTRQ